jgi:hypothetical protein
MLKKILTVFMIFIVFILPGLVNAAEPWNDGDINRVVNGLKNGTAIDIGRTHLAPQTAVIHVNFIRYVIDFRVQDCFITGQKGSAFTPYSCQKIKKGYPLFGSLITWE